MTTSDQLYSKANEIVQSLGLLALANQYSEAYQIGSSVMDLMVDTDIDFTCYHPDHIDEEKFFLFVRQLLKLPGVDTIKIKNYQDNPKYNQLKVNIAPFIYEGLTWKIAFSFQVKTENNVKNDLETITWVRSRLTPKTKKLILKLKLESRAENQKIPGFYIYQGVLGQGMTTLSQIRTLF